MRLSTLIFTVLWVLSARFVVAANSPDSLLTMTPQQQFTVIFNNYHKINNTPQADSMIQRLERFFRQKGTDLNLLTVKVTHLLYEHPDPAYKKDYLPKMQILLQESLKQENSFLVAKCHQAMGKHHLVVTKQIQNAFIHFNQLFELIKGQNETEFPGYNYAIYEVAQAYYEFFDYENTIRYGRALNHNALPDIYGSHIFNADLLGMAHLKLQQFDSARSYFDWALHQLPAQGIPNDAWKGILIGNIGLTYFEQKNYVQALPYLEQGLTLTKQYELWDNYPLFGAKLALIYLDRGQVNQALSLALMSVQVAKKANPIPNPVDIARFVAEPYQVLSTCYRALGNYKAAYLYADSAAVATARWKQQLDVKLKHKAEIALEQERYGAREQRLQQDKDQQILLRNSLLVFTFLIMLLALLLYNRQRLKNSHQQQQLRVEKQLAETELHTAHTLLTQLQQGIQQKSQLIAQFEGKLDSNPAVESTDPTQYQLLNELRRSVILTDADWKNFVDLFEKVHAGFFVRLKAKLPDLTPAETRFMALSRLGYSAREMADILGVGQGAIRQYRLQIRRKLNIQQEDLSTEDIARQI